MTPPLLPSTPAPPLPSTSAPLLLAKHPPAPPLRPSLEYHYAFDLCAMEARRQGGPVAVFASSAFYAGELLRRLDGQAVNGWTGNGWEAPPFAGPRADKRTAPVVSGPERDLPPSPPLPCPPSPPLPSSAHAAIWAEPEWKDGQRTLQEIVQALAPGGRLYVIFSGWLARFLPEWRRAGPPPAVRRAGGWRAQQWLRQAGLATEALYGFQVPLSLLWGYTGLALERLGRAEWADRCHFRMRAEYVARGRMALVTPVGVFVARKAG